MAWSSAALTAAEIADAAADKPLIAVQAIPNAPTVERWTKTGTTAGTDYALSTHPTKRAHDGQGGLVTKTDGELSATWYLTYDLAAAGVEFDCAFLIGHNLNTLGVTDLELSIADAADFATNLQTIHDFGAPASGNRLAALSLFHTGAAALRYSAVRYARLKIVGPGNITPEIGELILGRRRQLPRNPDMPWSPYGLANAYDLVRTDGGVIHIANRHRNRRDLSLEWPVEGATYVSDWRAFWAACDGPFVWCENPTTAPASWHLMIRDQEEIALEQESGTVHRAKLTASEQGPGRLYLANQ